MTVWPIETRMRRRMQRRMPAGWKIKINFTDHLLQNYQITRGETVLTIGPEGQCELPEGWQVEYRSLAFSSEITITAPDGVSVMIDDVDLA